jgi:hypothetical protein
MIQVRKQLIGSLLVFGAMAARVDAQTLTAVDTGFYNAAGRHAKYDGGVLGATTATFNYSTGAIDETPFLGSAPDVPRKSYFTFDLTGIASGTITAATLNLYMPASGYSGGATETYGIYGTMVPGSPAMTGLADDLTMVWDLTDTSPGGGLDKAMMLYGVLGDTKSTIAAFGTLTLSASSAGTTGSIAFTSTGLTYLNLFAGGRVVLAGILDSLDTAGAPDEDPDEYVYGFTAPVISGVVPWDMTGFTPTPTPELVLSVIPEPSSLLLTLGALIVFVRRRRWER